MDVLRGSEALPAPPPVEAPRDRAGIPAGPRPDVRATHMPVVDLVDRARAGDRRAFELLLDARLDRALGTAVAILGNEADARDATQEAFLRAWRELRQLRDSDRFDAWFTRILVNCCRTALRGRRRLTVREIPMDDLPELDDRAAGEGNGDQASLDAIEHAFERLSIAQRTILVLHHLEQRPVADIAARLGIPVGTAKSRLFAARQALERALEVELR